MEDKKRRLAEKKARIAKDKVLAAAVRTEQLKELSLQKAEERKVAEERRKEEEEKAAAHEARQKRFEEGRRLAREAWEASEAKRKAEEARLAEWKKQEEAAIELKARKHRLMEEWKARCESERVAIEAARAKVPCHPKLRFYSKKAREVACCWEEDARIVLQKLETDEFRFQCERIAREN